MRTRTDAFSASLGRLKFATALDKRTHEDAHRWFRRVGSDGPRQREAELEGKAQPEQARYDVEGEHHGIVPRKVGIEFKSKEPIALFAKRREQELRRVALNLR